MPEVAKPETVLVVDDEQTIVNVLVMGFKKAGIPTKTALTAEDAILLLEEHDFAAVVTDKNLPGKSGLELLRYVNEKRPNCARVMITGFVNTDSVLEALRLGADDYLLKPFESIMLVVERVKHAIAHRRTLAEREALSAALRKLETSLRKSEATAFQSRTELDLFQNVVELKIEDATRALQERVDELEGERLRLRATLKELAAMADDTLKQRLLAEVEILG
ncbi:MAG: response regulator [Archangium sp.]